MIEESDIDSSNGVNKASEDEELKCGIINVSLFTMTCGINQSRPHANKVLHHKLVYSFRRMRHVYFAFAILEVGLRRDE
jgi:hypothetical protein